MRKVVPLKIIWVEPNLNKDNKLYIKNHFKEKHKEAVTAFANTMDEAVREIDGCIKCLLIVTGAIGQHFVPRVEHMDSVSGIVVFCGNKVFHESWACKHPKIKGVYDEKDSLFAEMAT